MSEERAKKVPRAIGFENRRLSSVHEAGERTWRPGASSSLPGRVAPSKRWLTIAIILTMATAILAELPPDVYKDMQRKAPEVLCIQVSSVRVHRTFAKPSGCAFFDFEVIREVKADARVLRVVRSGSRVRAGDIIEIEYSSISRCSGWDGPRSIQMLQDGDRVYAFLARRGRTASFEPAARGASFSAAFPD